MPVLASEPVLDVPVLVVTVLNVPVLAVTVLDFMPVLNSIPDAEIKFQLGEYEMWAVSIGLFDVGVNTMMFSPSTGEEATLVDLDCERLVLGTDTVVKNAVLPVPREVMLYCESRPDISSLSKLLELEVPVGVEVIESELVVKTDTLSSIID